MSESQVSSTPGGGTTQRTSFFSQTGWLMLANIAGGAMMWLVHFLGGKIPPSEYGDFQVYLAMIICVPTMPLQTVLAHQTAQALARGRERELSGSIRAVWFVTTLLWVIAAVVICLNRNFIVAQWKITNPNGVWITLGVLLLSIWLPIVWGMLQGQQSFFWLGWSMMANGVGRLSSAAVLGLLFYAAGMMGGVAIGLLLAIGIAAWHSRKLWLTAPLPFDRRALIREVVPPMLGLAAFQFLFTGDTMFVKTYFDPDTTAFYGSAGTLSRALMWLVGPLAMVMFPRIVHSSAKSEHSNLMKLVFMGTGILALLGAISLSIIGPYIVRFIFHSEGFVKVASSVLPWYAGAMIPLALSNVLLNNLLAKSQFKIVIPMMILAVLYGFALTRFHHTLIDVLKTMGAFNLILLVVCGWFTISNPKADLRPSTPASN